MRFCTSLGSRRHRRKTSRPRSSETARQLLYQPTLMATPSSLRAQRSNPGAASSAPAAPDCARNHGDRDGWSVVKLTATIQSETRIVHRNFYYSELRGESPSPRNGAPRPPLTPASFRRLSMPAQAEASRSARIARAFSLSRFISATSASRLSNFCSLRMRLTKATSIARP
jgi:hypothetical protein